jgi:DNA-binding HxlR family transcriptional regulator
MDKVQERSFCPIEHGLGFVGEAWSMLILRNLASGATRFEQLRSALGIAPNILTQRLRALVEAGLVEKRRYSERPPRDEYVLSVAGRDFLPVLYVIGEWARRHHGEADMARLVDDETGRPVEAVVVDRATGHPLSGLKLRVVQAGDPSLGGASSKQ